MLGMRFGVAVLLFVSVVACKQARIPKESQTNESQTKETAAPETDAPTAAASIAAASVLNKLRFTVGKPFILLGPVSDLADNPLTVIPADGGIIAYTANSKTSRMQGASPESLKLTKRDILVPGPKGRFDDCGVWLQSAIPINQSKVLGWYHAERDCNYEANFETYKTVGAAVSNDGGLTFAKVGTTPVIKSPVKPVSGAQTGSGDQAVVRWRDHYYMYVLDIPAQGNWGNGVARAVVLPNGDAGPWLKWHNGSFSSPAIDGPLTQISGFTISSASVYEPEDMISAVIADPAVNGVKFSLSSDGVHFASLSDPLWAFDKASWGSRKFEDGDIVTYTSHAPRGGEGQWSNEFYLFNTFIHAGEDFRKRYLVGRRVGVASRKGASDPAVRMELARYYSKQSGHHRVTTAPVPASHDFEFSVGYVYTRKYPGMTALEECVHRDYHPNATMLSRNCAKENWQKARTVGWVWEANRPNTVPLYRCHYSEGRDYFISNRSDCENSSDKIQMDDNLGWAEAPNN